MGNNPGEAALGVALVLRKIRSVVPKARILLLGVFPTRKSDDQPRVRAVNDYLAKMDDGKTIRYLNINSRFMDKGGKLEPAGKGGSVLETQLESLGSRPTRYGGRIWVAV